MLEKRLQWICSARSYHSEYLSLPPTLLPHPHSMHVLLGPLVFSQTDSAELLSKYFLEQFEDFCRMVDGLKVRSIVFAANGLWGNFWAWYF